MEMSYPVETELPAGNYKLIYSVDFDDKKAMQRGTTQFQVTSADVALRSHKADTVAANKATANSSRAVENTSDKQTSTRVAPANTTKDAVHKKPLISNPPVQPATSKIVQQK